VIEVCTICEEALDGSKPYQRDLEGNGAHLECLETVEEEDDGE
jgi:hypothetical protein